MRKRIKFFFFKENEGLIRHFTVNLWQCTTMEICSFIANSYL